MIYDYICPKCKKIKEDIMHGAFEKPIIKCKCGVQMKIKMSAVSFVVNKSQGISGTNQDILRHQAGVLNETQGGL